MRRLALGAMWLGTACGGASGGLVQDNGQPPPRPVARAPRQPDAFADHTGEKVNPGQRFRIAANAVAVSGIGVVLELTRVEWSTLTAPSGKEMKEAVAHLVVRRGEDDRSLRVNQNDHKSAMGARIEVHAAGETYNRQRMTDEPWVELTVTAAPDR